LKGKGKQFVPAGGRVMLAFPGGAGYGNSAERDREMVHRDLRSGYISAETARVEYGISDAEIANLIGLPN